MPDAQGNTLLTQTAPLGFHGGSRVGVTGLICTSDCLRENRSAFLDAGCQGVRGAALSGKPAGRERPT